MSTEDTTSSLEDQIKASLDTGSILDLSYEEILSNASDKDASLIKVKFDFDPLLTVSTFSQLTGVFGGQSMTSVVPNGVLPYDIIGVRSVSFQLFTASVTIGQVSCEIVFGDNDDGLAWTVANINSAALTLTLNTIGFDWVLPLQEGSFLSGEVTGKVEISNLDLAVSVSFPDIVVEVSEEEGDAANIGEFFRQFGWESVSFLDNLYLYSFELIVAVNDGQVDIQSEVNTGDLDPLVLIGDSTNPILSLSELGFLFSSTSSSTQASIEATLICSTYLEVNTSAAFNSETNSWTFTGQINIPATATNLNPDNPNMDGDNYIVWVKDFAQIFISKAAADLVPDVIAKIGIEELSMSYTYTTNPDDNNTDDFKGVFAGDWTLGSSDVSAQLSVEVGSDVNAVSANFNMDGFEFSLGYNFSDGNGIISADIITLGISGSYDIDAEILEVTVDKTLYFGNALLYFVQSVSGNKFFSLGSPWEDA
ncbi:MAG: hypothetical protein JKY54_13095, partial [Flavobacteriales bacterium]|nr:hypothetical protein [Flavobacteriales bacterium]